MTDPFVGEIQILGFNFAPANWAFCNGATLPIQQFTPLFSLLGTNFGGNGTTTFQLPNFVERVPCAQGTPPGRSQVVMGQVFGEMAASLSPQQIPGHTHTWNLALSGTGPTNVPVANGVVTSPNFAALVTGQVANINLAPQSVSMTGQNQSHENRQPFLALNFCIALRGVFPSFN
jgi:microcystin-dependent protein